MATIERLGEALKNAASAGDEDAAKKFAAAIRGLQHASTSAPSVVEPDGTSLLE